MEGEIVTAEMLDILGSAEGNFRSVRLVDDGTAPGLEMVGMAVSE